LDVTTPGARCPFAPLGAFALALVVEVIEATSNATAAAATIGTRAAVKFFRIIPIPCEGVQTAPEQSPQPARCAPQRAGQPSRGADITGRRQTRYPQKELLGHKVTYGSRTTSVNSDKYLNLA
jgi:hypothetical protein